MSDQSIHLSEEADTRIALFAAIDEFFGEYFSFPDEVILNPVRRLSLPVQEWHSIKHGAIIIRVRSPHDATAPVSTPRSVPWNSFICVRSPVVS